MKKPNFRDHTSAVAASGFPDTAGTSMSFPPSMWRHCRQVCNLPPGTVAELHQKVYCRLMEHCVYEPWTVYIFNSSFELCSKSVCSHGFIKFLACLLPLDASRSWWCSRSCCCYWSCSYSCSWSLWLLCRRVGSGSSSPSALQWQTLLTLAFSSLVLPTKQPSWPWLWELPLATCSYCTWPVCLGPLSPSQFSSKVLTYLWCSSIAVSSFQLQTIF